MSIEFLLLVVGGAFGALVSRLFRLPMWPIVGAILGSATTGVLLDHGLRRPDGVSFFAQILVGTAVGASVLPGFLRQLGRLIVPALLVVLTLVAVGVSTALVLSHLDLVGSSEALLGMVPGGIGEMVAAASAMEANSALVAGIHVSRLLVSLWILPLIVRWAQTWDRPPEN
ncbi:AbrB family transcriptional regulator [Zhihengliuella halotolerans]|uniref:AbrB family transcriptional regulator n=1 Tax=Zhihengliuella halotolerans TaxID=370736 RepID=UPI0013EE78F9|nr:AbrB family transcriptional regulator [Zhihengliuella halotolerans]